jgi:predicted metal-dependent hydrolase
MFTSYQLRQDWTQELPKYWCDNSPFKSYLFNAMSLTFPEGERFYVQSVKAYKDQITDPALIEEIDEFGKQEYFHSYAHKQYNDWVNSTGLPAERLSKDVTKIINWANTKLTPETRLAVTVCQEHVTVILAVNGLTNRSFYRRMHPHFEHIWRWHNIEEIEHKSTSMKVWQAIDGDPKKLHRVMILATIVFWYTVLKFTVKMLHHDKQLWKWQTFKDAWKILCAKNGMFSFGRDRYLAFFKKDYTPDAEDDSLLLNYRKS